MKTLILNGSPRIDGDTSRLQTYFCARFFRNEEPIAISKKGAVILVGGGDDHIDKAYSTACTLLHIPPELTPQQTSAIYTSEADVLNMALFGMTAKQWRDKNPDKKGNIRDYASINELICLSNMENINAVLIEDGLNQKERLIKLNKIAIHQMSILEEQTTKILK